MQDQAVLTEVNRIKRTDGIIHRHRSMPDPEVSGIRQDHQDRQDRAG
jgi:hypothetical protein